MTDNPDTFYCCGDKFPATGNYYDCSCGTMWMKKSCWFEQKDGSWEKVSEWLAVPDSDPVFKAYIMRHRLEDER